MMDIVLISMWFSFKAGSDILQDWTSNMMKVLKKKIQNNKAKCIWGKLY